IKVAGWVGLVGIVLTAATGHGSAVEVSRTQPMKLAAMEGLWNGGHGQELVAFGILNPEKTFDNDVDPYLFKIGLPGALSVLARNAFYAFVPGIYVGIAGRDFVGGKPLETVAYTERMERGRAARAALAEYSVAVNDGNAEGADAALKALRADYPYFGYGYYDSPADFIPPVAVTFYSFHIMVLAGGYLMAFIAVMLLLAYVRPMWLTNKWLCLLGMVSIAIVWICSQAGWVCAEVGRQPWVIQDLMPTRAAISALSVESVRLTFWLFAAVFTALLAAEASIMLRQISIHSKETEE
ncbi:MAG: cytochrome ubiquinol oxidase subunit I, partial [Muribaculaceae bacterium]|nr:cytochrome ubiquinol oxidase subunit I [Muribaculaceae bacterium]